MPSPGETAAQLARDAVDALPAGELERKLALGRQLRVKLGIDPTAPDIHLGHTVVLRKLREFQDAGHLVVLIVGDFTARVGDPTGRSELRPLLSAEEIAANAASFHEQAATVLDSDPARLEIRRNSEWLDMDMSGLLRLVSTTTVGALLERDDFTKRREAGAPISMLEMLYPLLQGYDSVAVRADVELGGTDQKFNLLLARDIQRAYGAPEQAILTMPILPGTDGVRKMSKSLGNHIGVAEPPEEVYGKAMSIPDELIEPYFRLVLGQTQPELGPRDAKHALAKALVERFHSEPAAQAAAERFAQLHVARGLPDDVPEAPLPDADPVHVPTLLAELFGLSRSEARRLVEQGGVRVDDGVLDRLDVARDELDGRVLRVGRRRFVRLHSGG